MGSAVVGSCLAARIASSMDSIRSGRDGGASSSMVESTCEFKDCNSCSEN